MNLEIGNVMYAAQQADTATKAIVNKPVESLSVDEVKQVRQARMLLANVSNVLANYIQPRDGHPATESTEQV